MTASAPTLNTINVAAADLIEHAGWTQGTEKDNAGRVCLTGALRHCNPQPGDFHLAREVYRRLNHGENWNDDDTRTAADVVTYLREHPITDDLLAATYGPQWQAIVAHIRRAAVLTADEAQALLATRDATGGAPWLAGWLTARDATGDATWVTARDAARALVGEATWEVTGEATGEVTRDATGDATGEAPWLAGWLVAARDAARGATWALVARDLLLATPDGTEHYKTLTRPWAQTIGPVHPDDEPVTT